MLSKIKTLSIYGLHTEIVIVETDLGNGLPGIHMVGLPDITVREARERVRGSLMNSGYGYPAKRITINFSPADVRKAGTHYDLPMAVGILRAAGHIRGEHLTDSVFLGELSLDGQLGKIQGALPLVMGAWEGGIKRVFLPRENVEEACLVKGVEIFPIDDLKQLVELLNSRKIVAPPERKEALSLLENEDPMDYKDVIGQESAKRAMVIGATGYHNMILTGEPGAGKSMLARRLPSILPPMSQEEIFQTTKIYSVAGALSKKEPVICRRPFRMPHHTISPGALIGGGFRLKPGELSLANHGVLFLDEIAEFPREVVEALRQPLEDGEILINRISGSVTYPCQVLLIAASNPCKCGHYGSQSHVCSCTEAQIRSYQDRLSGPLLDRIDIAVRVMRVPLEEALGMGETDDYLSGILSKNLSSKEMKEMVLKGRERQEERFAGSSLRHNSQMEGKELDQFCPMDKDARKFSLQAAEKMGLSMRGYKKMLRVSRTLADLEREGVIRMHHLAEALQYRG